LLTAKRRRTKLLAAISPVPFLSVGRNGIDELVGPVNRRADVYRLGSSLSRSRVCWGAIASLWLSFPGDAGEAAAAVSQRNKPSQFLPRPFGIHLRRPRRDRERSLHGRLLRRLG
jgi:hypothetical protein